MGPSNRFTRSRRSSASRTKTVFVHRYRRYRFGRWENVCQHFRSPPGQLTLGF